MECEECTTDLHNKIIAHFGEIFVALLIPSRICTAKNSPRHLAEKANLVRWVILGDEKVQQFYSKPQKISAAIYRKFDS